MKIAVTMSTFQRKDGKSPFYLERALNSVFSQEYQDFYVILVGDNYENKKELEDIVKKYDRSKIQAYNLIESQERNEYSQLENKYILWSCAGVTAINVAIKLAFKKGYDYICHLDHDDYWGNNHLKVINTELESGADFVYTKSTYGNGIYLPNIDIQENVVARLPVPGGIINSATCFNFRKIPLLYRNMYKECGTPIPADSDLWERIGSFIVENNLFSRFVNLITCYHPEEGYILYDGQ